MVACLLWVANPVAVFAANFTASFDRETITLGETATLTLTFEGGTPDSVPTPPSNGNIRVQEAGSSTAMNLGNGEVQQTETHLFIISPTQLGTYTFPAMTTRIGNETVKSQPVKLNVVKPGPPPATQANAISKWAFLKLIVPKDTAYIGEVLPIELQLYFVAQQNGEMPHIKEEGFTLGKIVQQNPSSTMVNGQQFNVITLKTFVVPAKVGKLDMGPATMSLQVPAATGRDWFGRTVVTQWQPATLESEPKSLQVLPLPRDNVPPGFNGAVGAYIVAIKATPTNIAVGDPITIKVEITGRGSLESINLPTQTNWDQFKLYPPTSSFQPSDQLGISGTRTFALTAVPESLETRELPPYVFSFFDPETRTYRTMTQPATALIVRPSAASLPPPNLNVGVGAAENIPVRSDINHIKPRLGVVAQIQPPLVRQAWFVALQGLPALAWMALLIRRKQAERLASNPRLRRQRQVEQIVRDGLKELHQYAASNQAPEFFATLFHLLQEQLGERLDLPASAITEAVLDERLRPLNVPEEQLDALRELFQICNQARYAQQSTNEEMQSLITKVESALQYLKQLNA